MVGPLMEALTFTGPVWGVLGVGAAGPDGWALAAALAALLGVGAQASPEQVQAEGGGTLAAEVSMGLGAGLFQRALAVGA